MKKISLAVAAAVAMGAVGSVSAQSATIGFTGKIATETCVVDIGGSGSTATIVLPTVTPAQLTADPTAGSQNFTVSLGAGNSADPDAPKCDLNNAELVVDRGVLTPAGNLRNTVAVADGPTNAVVAIYRTQGSTTSRVDLSKNDDLRVTRTANTSPFAPFQFQARYLNESGAATAITGGDYAGQMIFTVSNY